MAASRIPELDDELRARLGRRFGTTVQTWLDELPPVLSDLADRWQVEYESLIQRGGISVVIRCRRADGRAAVLKISPARRRVLDEAAALASWKTDRVPAVLALDGEAGALLLEAIEPGTPLDESAVYPCVDRLGALMTALHANAALDPSYESVAERIGYLYEAGMKNYERRPDLAELISPELYERGRQLAMRLSEEALSTVLLHGDLTPVNVLDGGTERGLVAIDPAPCLGDPAFDAIDLVLWRADDLETVTARANRLAPAIGAEPERLLSWCGAFAAMTALELAEAGNPHEDVTPRVALATART